MSQEGKLAHKRSYDTVCTPEKAQMINLRDGLSSDEQYNWPVPVQTKTSQNL